MNKIFRVIWNHSTQTWQAVSELAKGQTKSESHSSNIAVGVSNLPVFSLSLIALAVVSSLPAYGLVVAGTSNTGTGSNSGSPGAMIVGNDNSVNANVNVAVMGNGITVTSGKSATVSIGSQLYNDGVNSVLIGSGGDLHYGNSVSIGSNVKNNGLDGIAIGNGTSLGNNVSSTVAHGSVAIGGGFFVDTGTILGVNTRAIYTADNTVTSSPFLQLQRWQRATSVVGNASTALGTGAVIAGNGAMALGAMSNAKNNGAIAMGLLSNASGEGSTALGLNTRAASDGSIAIGTSASVTQREANANAGNSIAIGREANVTHARAIAIGYQANATHDKAIAIGNEARGYQEDTIAIGRQANATGLRSMSIGINATASGEESLAVLRDSQATGQFSMALGYEAKVQGDAANAIAIGRGATTNKAGSVVLGNDSTATGSHTIATETGFTLAAGACATTHPATTFNNFAGAVSGDGMFVSVGSSTSPRKIINVAAGNVSATSTEAINGSQLFSVAKNFDDRLKAIGEPSLLALDAARRLEQTNFKFKVQNGTTAAADAKSWAVDGSTQDITFKSGNFISVASPANGQIQFNTVTQDVTIDNDGKATRTGTDGLATAASVVAAVNGASFNLKANGAGNTKIKAGDTVNFVDGNDITITETGGTVTVGLKAETKKLLTDTNATAGAAKTAAEAAQNTANTANTAAQAAQTTANEAKATADKGWKLNTNQTTGGSATGSASTKVGADQEVMLTAGKNMNLTQNGKQVTFAVTDTPTFTTLVTTGVATIGGKLAANGGVDVSNGLTLKSGGLTVENTQNLNFGNNRLQSVAEGTADNDAVTLGQLKSSSFRVQAGANRFDISKDDVLKFTNGKNTVASADRTGESVSINAWDTKVVPAAGGLVSVSTNDNAQNYTREYTLDLTQDTKDDISNAKQDAADALVEAKKGWTITADKTGSGNLNNTPAGSETAKVAPGENVKFIAGDNLNVTQSGKSITFSVNKAPTFDSVTVAAAPTDGNHLTNKTYVDGKVAEKLTSFQLGANDEATLGTVNNTNNVVRVKQGATGLVNVSRTDNNITVDVVKGNVNNDFTKGTDGVVDAAQLATTATKLKELVETSVSTDQLSVNAAGKYDTPAAESGKKLMNVSSVAAAINAAGFKLKDKATDGGELVNAGDEVAVSGEGNVVVTRTGTNLAVKTKDDVTFSSVDGLTKITAIDDVANQNKAASVDTVKEIVSKKAEWNVQNNGTGDKKVGGDKKNVNFADGTHTTATVADETNGYKVAFNVKEATVTKGADGQYSQTTAGVVTGDTLANTVNQAVGDLTNKGFNLTTSAVTGGNVSGNAAEHKVAMGQTITLEAGKNVNLTQAAGKVTIAVNDNPTFGTVTATEMKAGNNVLNANGLTVPTDDANPNTNPITITKDGINAGNKAITNVGSGKGADTNVANIQDVKDIVAENAEWKLKNNTGAEKKVGGAKNIVDFVDGKHTTAVINDTTNGYNVTFNVKEATFEKAQDGTLTKKTDGVVNADTLVERLNDINSGMNSATFGIQSQATAGGTEGGKVTNTLNNTVKLAGGNSNINTGVSGTDTVTVNLNPVLTGLTSASFGNTNPLVVSDTGINLNDKRITNSASGLVSRNDTDNKNVANIGDVKELAHWTIKANGENAFIADQAGATAQRTTGANKVAGTQAVNFVGQNGVNVVLQEQAGKAGYDVRFSLSSLDANAITREQLTPAEKDQLVRGDALEKALEVVTDKGMTFVGDDSNTKVSRKLGETLTIAGGAPQTDLSENNIGVKYKDASSLSVQLAKNLSNLTTVTMGAKDSDAVTLSGQAVTIGKDNTKVTLEKSKLEFANSVKVDGTNKTITGLAEHSITATDYGTGDNVSRAATEKAVKEVSDKIDTVATTGFNVAATVGTAAKQSLGKTLSIVETAGFTENGVEYVGTNLKTKVVQTAEGEMKVEIGLNKNIQVEKLDLKDDQGNATSVTPNGVTNVGENGVSALGDKGLEVAGTDVADGSTKVGKDGVSVTGRDGVDGKSELGKDGLTVSGKDGENGKTTVGKDGLTITNNDNKPVVSVKEDDQGNGVITVAGKDGTNGISINGADGKITGLTGITPDGVDVTTLSDTSSPKRSDLNNQAVTGKDLFNLIDNGLRLNADQGGKQTHKLGKEIAVVALTTETATANADYSGDNVKTFIKQDEATGKTTIEVGLKKDIKVEKLELTDKDGNATAVTPAGVATSNDNGTSVLNPDGLNVMDNNPANGGTTVAKDGVTVAGKDGVDGKSELGKDGLTVSGKDGENGTTTVGKDGLTITNEQNKPVVEVKEDAQGNGVITVAGKDGTNGITITAEDGANGKSEIAFKDNKGAINGLEDRTMAGSPANNYGTGANANRAATEGAVLDVVNTGLNIAATVGESNTLNAGDKVQKQALRKQLSIVKAENPFTVGTDEFNGDNLMTRVTQDAEGNNKVEIGLKKNISVEKLELTDKDGNATTVTPAGVATSNDNGTSVLNPDGLNVMDNNPANGGTTVAKDGVTVAGKDGVDGKSELGKDGLTVTNADGSKETEVSPEGVSVNGANGTTVVSDGTVGVNGKDGSSTVGQNGLTVTGTGADGDKGTSTVGKDGLSVKGKDGKDAVDVKATDNGSQIALNGKDGKNGITITADGSTDGKSEIKFNDNNGVVDGLKGIVGTTPTGGTAAISDITRLTPDERTAYNNQAVAAKDLFNLIDNGLRLSANQGNKQTHKLGNEIEVVALAAENSGYVGDNLKTFIKQDAATGTTTIEVGLKKDIKVEKLELTDKDGNATTVTPAGVATSNDNGTSVLNPDGLNVMDSNPANGGTTVAKDGVTVAGKDGVDGKSELGKDGLTVTNADGSKETEVSPEGVSVNGANGTTVVSDGTVGVNGKDGSSTVGQNGLTVSGTGADGDKGTSTVGKDGLSVKGKDGQDAVDVKATDNGSQIALNGKDGKNGITITADGSTDGKSEIKFNDNNGAINGLENRSITNASDNYGKGDNANRAATEGAVLDVVNTGLNIAATVGKANTEANNVQKQALRKQLSIVKAENPFTVGTDEFNGDNLMTRVTQDADGNNKVEIGLKKNISVEKLELTDKDGNATTVTPAGVATSNDNGTSVLNPDGLNVMDNNPANGGTTVAKDGVTVAGKDGVDGKSELGKDGLTVTNADGSKETEVSPEGVSVNGANGTTVVSDGTVGVNGKDGSSTVGQNGLTVTGTGADGDKGTSTVGKDGLSVKGKDGKDAVDVKATDNGSQIALNGKDGKNGITITAEDGANGKSAIEFKDNKGVIDGLKGITPAGADADITKVADGDRTALNNQAVAGRDLFNLIDNGLRLNANEGGQQTHKLGKEIAVVALTAETANANADYSGDNVKTFIKQDEKTGKTTIEVGLKKDIKVEKLELTDKDGNATTVTPTGVATSNDNGTSVLNPDGLNVMDSNPANGGTTVAKDGVSVAGKDGVDGKSELGKDGLTVTNADGTKETEVSPEGVSVNGANGTTVVSDGTVGVNGKDGSSTVGQNGLTVTGTGADGDKGTSTVGKDGLSVKGKDGKDAVDVKATDNGSQISLKGKDGTNGITITAEDGANGKSEIAFKDNKGAINGLEDRTMAGSPANNYGTGANANRAATEGAVLDVVNTGLNIAATVGESNTLNAGDKVQKQALRKQLSIVKAENPFTVGTDEFNGDNLMTRVTQDAEGNNKVEIGLKKNISVEKLELTDKDGNATTVTPTGVATSNDNGTSVLNPDGLNVMDSNPANGGTTVAKDGVSVAGKDGVDGKSELGKDGLTVTNADGSKETEVSPEGVSVNGANGTTVVSDGTVGVNGKDGSSTVGQNGLTVTGTGADGDKGTSTVGKDGLSVKGKDGKDAVDVKATDNGSQIALNGKDGKNGITITADGSTGGKSEIKFNDNNGVVDGLKGIVGTTPAGSTTAATDITRLTPTERTAYNNQAVAAKDLFNLIDNGLRFNANQGGLKTHKLGNEIEVIALAAENSGYVGDNLKTFIKQDEATGKTTIEVGLKKNISVEKLDLVDDKGNTTSVNPTGVTTTDKDGNTTTVTPNGVTNVGKDGVSSLSDKGLEVAGEDVADGSTNVGKDGVSVTGRDGVDGKSSLGKDGLTVSGTGADGDKGSSTVGKDGLSVKGKDGQDAVDVKATDNGSQISLKGKDGTNGITITAEDGANGKSAIEFKDNNGVVDGLKGIVGTTPAGSTTAATDITRLTPDERTAYNNQAVSGKDLFNVIDNGLRLSANQGNKQTHKLGNEIEVVALAAENGGYVGDNLRTFIKQDAATGTTTIEVGLKKNISVEKLDLVDDKGNTTSVNPTGVTTTDKDGNTTTVTPNGVTNVGKDGVSSLSDKGLEVAGEDVADGSTKVGKDGVSVTGRDGVDGKSSLGKDGLTVVGKDGKDGVSTQIGNEGLTVKGPEAQDGTSPSLVNIGKDATGNGNIAVNGKDGKDGVSIGASDNGGVINIAGRDAGNQAVITNNNFAMTATDPNNPAQSNTFSIENSPNGAKISGVAEGDISPTSNQVVTGKQLYPLTGGTEVKTAPVMDVNGNAVEKVVVTDSTGKEYTLTTYNVHGQSEVITNNVVTAVHNMNEQGIKFFHTNDGEARPKREADNTVDSSASGAYATAVGFQAKAEGTQAIAMGHGSQASGTQSLAIGTGNVVSGNHSGAIGDPNKVEADSSYVYGNNNTVGRTARSSFAVGNDNNIQTENTYVLGSGIKNTLANSVFLGNNSGYVEAGKTTAGNRAYESATINGQTYRYAGGKAEEVVGVVSVGNVSEDGVQQTRRIQNVAPGLISRDSTDAINGSQLYSAMGNINYNINNLGNRMNRIDRDLRSGIAGAVAIGSLVQAYNPSDSILAVGGGTYRGASALAVGYSKVSDNGRVIFKVNGSVNNAGHYMGGASVGFKF